MDHGQSNAVFRISGEPLQYVVRCLTLPRHRSAYIRVFISRQLFENVNRDGLVVNDPITKLRVTFDHFGPNAIRRAFVSRTAVFFRNRAQAQSDEFFRGSDHQFVPLSCDRGIKVPTGPLCFPLM
jgi:hypothetical protein